MSVIRFSLISACLSMGFMASLQAAELPTCESSVTTLNNQLQQQSLPPIHDENDLVKTLRYLQQNGRLPSRYITTQQAMYLGWSGRATDTLWGLKPTNGKWIGGDESAQHPEGNQGSWYSADLDSYKGLRGDNRLLYSPNSAMRYISNQCTGQLTPVQPCQ